MGLNKNVTILRNDLSVPVRCLFPFINSKASPSDYIYSSALKPSKNEPFHFQKSLIDTSVVNLLKTQWHCYQFTAAGVYQNPSSKRELYIFVNIPSSIKILYAAKWVSHLFNQGSPFSVCFMWTNSPGARLLSSCCHQQKLKDRDLSNRNLLELLCS